VVFGSVVGLAVDVPVEVVSRVTLSAAVGCKVSLVGVAADCIRLHADRSSNKSKFLTWK
jgi:hypothetical protein